MNHDRSVSSFLQRAFLNVILESRVSDVRIPQGLVPVSYDVALVPHLDTDFSLSGAVSVALTVRAESTSQIYLHSKVQLGCKCTNKEGG